MQLTVEEVRERQQRLAKMRSLLFQHEAKAKRVRNIKSKTFHRLQKDHKHRAEDTDAEAVKDAALKQEVKHAEVRVLPLIFVPELVICHFLEFLEWLGSLKYLIGREAGSGRSV